MTQETLTIENKTGIHARPASIFVQTATKFKSKIQLQAKGKTIDAKSILMIMSGRIMVKALKDLIESKFGEE